MVSGSARAAEAEADYQPTFATEVASILQQKCQVCHQPNSIAPMSLLTYQEARPWARSIKARVAGTMIAITAWHDNSEANRNNPDARQWVGGGSRTVDEMAHAWVDVTYLEEAEYEAELERRKALTDNDE